MHILAEYSPEVRPPHSIERTRANARRRVLDAARELLRQVSYDRFTIDAVAARAGLSRRTIYNQFANRDDLYRASRIELLLAFEDKLPREIPPHPDLQPTIERFCTTAINALLTPEHRELMVSVQRDREAAPWLAQLYRLHVDRPIRMAIEHYLLMQKAFGALEIDDPSPHARSLLASIKATVSAPDATPVFRASELALLFAVRIQTKALRVA